MAQPTQPNAPTTNTNAGKQTPGVWKDNGGRDFDPSVNQTPGATEADVGKKRGRSFGRSDPE